MLLKVQIINIPVLHLSMDIVGGWDGADGADGGMGHGGEEGSVVSQC